MRTMRTGIINRKNNFKSLKSDIDVTLELLSHAVNLRTEKVTSAEEINAIINLINVWQKDENVPTSDKINEKSLVVFLKTAEFEDIEYAEASFSYIILEDANGYDNYVPIEEEKSEDSITQEQEPAQGPEPQEEKLPESQEEELPIEEIEAPQLEMIQSVFGQGYFYEKTTREVYVLDENGYRKFEPVTLEPVK